MLIDIHPIEFYRVLFLLESKSWNVLKECSHACLKGFVRTRLSATNQTKQMCLRSNRFCNKLILWNPKFQDHLGLLACPSWTSVLRYNYDHSVHLSAKTLKAFQNRSRIGVPFQAIWNFKLAGFYRPADTPRETNTASPKIRFVDKSYSSRLTL